MNRTVRYLASSMLLMGLLFCSAEPAAAQTFSIYASSSDLTPSGGAADAQCLAQVGGGTVVFYNTSEQGIYEWDGSSLTVHTAPSTLQSNITAVSENIDRCDGVFYDATSGSIYFSLRASNETNQPNYIYRTSVADATDFDFVELDGVLSVEVYNSELYFASYAFFDDTGTREDGIYKLPLDLSGTPTAVATNADLSLGTDIAIDDAGTLYAYSNSFADGNFGQKVVSVDLTAASPTFQVFVDPYASGSPLTTGDDNLNLADLDFVTFGGTDYLVAYNEGSADEFATIRTSDQQIDLLFEGADIVSNTSAGGYTSSFADPLAVASDGTLYVGSRDGSSSTDYIASASGAAPLPVELTAFTATANGQAVTLRWQTASETNNAGFYVQHRAPGASWSTLRFVEGAGTTTTPQRYAFTAEALSPGTHAFRLRQVDLDGTATLSDLRTITVRQQAGLVLQGAHPVTAGRSVPISVQLPGKQAVRVSLYNVLGQRVQTISRGTTGADGRLQTRLSTEGLASGLYFVQVQGASRTYTKRLSIVQ
ncbi:T9SS type A sorting domain-containing protein [Salisaeta longa]|uniref:T9SS type A sorting domain-containing protein n=1 Tax=Salisaeta longa TaxID=503170 RepID=UPI0003B627DB|nr:T9SS type A sorting domain-containing protein [Salisaeta longa]